MLASAAGAQGQTPEGGKHRAPPADVGDSDENALITVRGQKLPGSVVGDISPEIQYGPADIHALGVSTITELLDELGPEVRSDRGRGGESPVVLLNGRRISSFAEIRNIPTEAIQRAEILPEEVALKYGYSANQRVVNIVLRRRFRAITGEAGGSLATEGAGSSATGEADLLRIRGDSRINLDVKYQDTANILESDRSVISNVPAGQSDGTDISPYRTLSPATKNLTANAVLARKLFGNFSGTANATFGYNDSDSLRGLPSAIFTLPAGNPFSASPIDETVFRYLGTTPLAQSVTTYTGHLGFSVNGDVRHWRLSFTGNYDINDTMTLTQRGYDAGTAQTLLNADDPGFNPFAAIPSSLLMPRAADQAHARSGVGNIQMVANGPLFSLPAGSVSSTFTLGGETSSFDAQSTRRGLFQTSDLSRNIGHGKVNVDIPLTSRKGGFLGAIGNLTANVNVAVDQLSDFGTLTAYGYGANWAPVDSITLIASVTHDRNPPTVQQLGNPVILTPDTRVFDYLRGQTVFVNQIDSGSAGLLADKRHVFKLGLTVKPKWKEQVTFSANYIRTTIRNAISALPEPTAAIEAAFPDRFMRDADGDLTQIDVQPVNFAREDSQELRWGFNFSKSLHSSNADKLAEVFRERMRQRAASGQAGPNGWGGRDRDESRPGGASGDGPAPAGSAGGRPPEGGPPSPERLAQFMNRRLQGARQSGRLQVSFYHTWHFRDDVLIRQGLPVLDLLHGDTIGGSGGQPTHELEGQFGYSNNGFGARVNAKWQSATSVNGVNGVSGGTLFFNDLATANLRFFADLGQQPSLARKAWARGLRVTLAVNNLFDGRLHVHDASGVTPLRYQPAYLDPLGRTIKLSIRKLFY